MPSPRFHTIDAQQLGCWSSSAQHKALCTWSRNVWLGLAWISTVLRLMLDTWSSGCKLLMPNTFVENWFCQFCKSQLRCDRTFAKCKTRVCLFVIHQQFCHLQDCWLLTRGCAMIGHCLTHSKVHDKLSNGRGSCFASPKLETASCVNRLFRSNTMTSSSSMPKSAKCCQLWYLWWNQCLAIAVQRQERGAQLLCNMHHNKLCVWRVSPIFGSIDETTNMNVTTV